MEKLIAYLVDGHELEIRPAPLERDWMDATSERYAYRCLPLNVANAHGWEILSPSGFTALWSGAEGKPAVVIAPDPGTTAPAVSHFGSGVLTFHINAIFRTDPGVDLYVTGPLNRPKDAIAGLTGIVETDWSPFSFTMNWRFTRSRTSIRFERGEPFCHIFPIERGRLERVRPEICDLSKDPQLEANFQAWSAQRSQFNTDLGVVGSEAQRAKWQKDYVRGPKEAEPPPGSPAHRTRLKLQPFTRQEG